MSNNSPIDANDPRIARLAAAYQKKTEAEREIKEAIESLDGERIRYWVRGHEQSGIAKACYKFLRVTNARTGGVVDIRDYGILEGVGLDDERKRVKFLARKEFATLQRKTINLVSQALEAVANWINEDYNDPDTGEPPEIIRDVNAALLALNREWKTKATMNAEDERIDHSGETPF